MNGRGSKCIATIIVFLSLFEIKYVPGFYLLYPFRLRFCVSVCVMRVMGILFAFLVLRPLVSI